jgi:predicted O-methyltransferase YrrM
MSFARATGIAPRVGAVGSGLLDRAAMVAGARRLGWPRDSTSMTVAESLASAVRGRASPEEQAWIERIEERLRHAFSVYAGVPPVWGWFLMKLVRGLAPRSSLELGTGWGISGAYQAAALELNETGSLITIDAGAEWARAAEKAFGELGLRRIRVRIGRLIQALGPELVRVGPVDYAFVDAEHDGPSTQWYFEAMLPHLSPGAVVVFDDINWSRDMRAAWSMIRTHPAVGRSVGLRRMGLVMLSRQPERASPNLQHPHLNAHA